MERAGLAVARLLIAIAPHAKSIWIPCGPGNNGGDGFIAARFLQEWGKNPIVTRLSNTPPAQPDARAAFESALAGKVTFQNLAPEQFDACIDAIFGIGLTRDPDERYTNWLTQINGSGVPVLSIDIPSGLNADTGQAAALHVCASATLSLLTLKPGLFTSDGRDACGDIWFNSLEVSGAASACAKLNVAPGIKKRQHNSHKGSYGDVVIVGGAPGMRGAAQLAARAALYSGAGRVYVIYLDAVDIDPTSDQPELMTRSMGEIDFSCLTVVAGCGGGTAISSHLALILRTAARLVLDADALNAIAGSSELQELTRARTQHSTVMTPHPLEAARLLATDTRTVQADRLDAARQLSQMFSCTVVLKGSGTIITAPDETPRINATGNARLASPGTGDVLAGLVGALMAGGDSAFHAACGATYRHGRVADLWAGPGNLTAECLAASL